MRFYSILGTFAPLSLASSASSMSAWDYNRLHDPSNSTIGTSNISTGNPSHCEHPTAFFRQFVDHSLNTTLNNTFLQQYQIISDYWKPDGPILFYQGAENPNILCLEDLSLPTFAKELGALMVGIEHRYFGASIPYGLNVSQSANWTLQQWGALSLENVLDDSVTLLKWLKKTNHSLENSKVITFGGSYGAFLTATEKIKHPDVFYGAVPTCGVYNGFNTNPNSSVVYGFTDWASNVYADLSAPAASIIRTGFNAIRSLMEIGDFSALSSALSLCTSPTSANQTDQLLQFILSDYIQNAQDGFSTPIPSLQSPEQYLIPPHQLVYLVNETLAASNPLAAINASIRLVLARSNQTCLPWDGGSSNEYSSKQLYWIICNYLPYPAEDYARSRSIFGQIGNPDPSVSNINDAFCQAQFGINARKGDLGYQQKVGISREQLMAQERMFFVQGQYDPVSGVGLDSWVASADRNQSRWWFMAEAAHTEDILKPTVWDTKPLVDTREAQLSYMKYWLGLESD